MFLLPSISHQTDGITVNGTRPRSFHNHPEILSRDVVSLRSPPPCDRMCPPTHICIHFTRTQSIWNRKSKFENDKLMGGFYNMLAQFDWPVFYFPIRLQRSILFVWNAYTTSIHTHWLWSWNWTSWTFWIFISFLELNRNFMDMVQKSEERPLVCVFYKLRRLLQSFLGCA